ncbi:MAG: hypothetical protein ACK595_10610 [Planctomycetota bacterium]
MRRDEDRLPSLDHATLVRDDSSSKLDAVPLGLMLALPSKRCLSARPRQRGLLHNGHVEARLAKLLLEATNRESPRNLNRSLTRRRINSEIHNPSVEIGGELTEQPVATKVGVPTRERAKEVVQHALEDPP